MRPVKVIVVGAGIGGLAATVALRKAGFAVQLYERRDVDEHDQLGSGLTLWSNAVRALAVLGLDSAVRGRARVLTLFDNQTSRGRSIARWELAEDLARYGQPSVNITRDALHRILGCAAGSYGVHYGSICTGVAPHPGGVRVSFADGSQADADVLVGADGVNSTVRQALHGPGTSRYSGYPIWRALVDIDHPAIAAATHRQLWGRGARFGYYRVGPDGELYWWATTGAAEDDVEPPQRRQARLLDLFGGWADPVQQILRATPPERIARTRVYHAAPLRSWGRGPVTLLGDAAHAMTFNVGQGACQAIEDAVVLAHHLSTNPEPAVALRRYETERVRRTGPMVRRARVIGRLGALRGPAACAVRDALLRRVLPGPAQARHRQDMEVALPALSP